jgi:hypothetical protein
MAEQCLSMYAPQGFDGPTWTCVLNRGHVGKCLLAVRSDQERGVRAIRIREEPGFGMYFKQERRRSTRRRSPPGAS